MDFLEKATDKLDIKDKLPGQVKDKLPGGGGGGGGKERKQGEGSHLSKSNRPDDDDDGGFPRGLRPSDWMGDLIAKNLAPASAAVTEFRYPGSHDAATYGSGLESFSYQCQEKNFYEQMETGNRCFDLRLAPEDNGKKFIPVHGIAKNTANDFNSGPKEAAKDDLASQILRFAKEHPKEILIFQVRVEGMKDVKGAFADSIWHLLGDRLLEAPENGRVPTYEEAVRSNRNIIFGLQADMKGHQIEKYIWKVGGHTECWIGDGDQLLWNEPTWQSGEIKKVLNSTEEFMQKNETKTRSRDKFWVAYLQLTPVFGQSISTFIKEGGSVRPKDLALGGGIGTHGEFQGSNKELRQSGVFKKPLWKQNASCVLYDFCDPKTTGAIVEMNIDADFKSQGGGGGRMEGGGGRDDREEHEGPSRGGRGGRGGGRGGRGGHDGPADFDDNDERGGGRGGGRGGRGGGRGEMHEGGRGGRGRGGFD